MKQLNIFLISLLFLLVTSSYGLDVTLSWDPSPSAAVTGYNVYYKSGDMSLPFDGTGADQGNSPIDVGDTLSTTLTGLTDGVIYFFTVTAYDGSDNQSTYSNIVSNDWIPSLQTPQDGASNEPVPVTFQWELAPSGYSVTYTLFFGTDQQEVSDAVTTSITTIPTTDPTIWEALLWLSGLGLVATHLMPRSSHKCWLKEAAVLLMAFGLLSACGGGGGGGGSETSSSSTRTAATEEESVLYSLDKGSSDYHQAFDLESGTTYYWKIVATDTDDSTLKYESQVQSFTTEAF